MNVLFSLILASVVGNHITRKATTSGYDCGGCKLVGWSYFETCTSGSSDSPMVNLYSNEECGRSCPDFEDVRPDNRRQLDAATGWENELVIQITVRADTSYQCGVGYYMFGFRCNCGLNGRRGGFPTALVCRRASNLDVKWGNNNEVIVKRNNPWDDDDGPFNCDVGTYLVGFSFGQKTLKELNLLCVRPPDVLCANPPDQNTTFVTVGGGCSTIHQYCVIQVTCKPFYKAVAGNRYGECTNTGQYNQTLMACVDINECVDTPNICGQNSVCTNLVGPPGYSCSCRPGYKSVGGVCTNVNECLTDCVLDVTNPIASQCNNCGAYLCADTPGNFTCSLPPNPCNNKCNASVSTHCNSCSSLADCLYTFPAPYTCVCPSGYSSTDQGRTCIDINECSSSPCVSASTSTCVNLNGTYKCNCFPGYSQTGSTAPCLPVDECAVNSNLCAGGTSLCRDTTPHYYCLPDILGVTRNKVSTPFTLGSALQSPPEIVEVTVSKESNCIRADQLSFGNTNQFRTDVCNVTNVTSSKYTLVCPMPPGGGRNLSFSLQCCLNYTVAGSPTPQCVSATSPTRVFSYPKPTLTPGTLTYAGNNGSTGIIDIDAEISGVVVTMSGNHFFPTELTVFFGPTNMPLAYPCSLVSANATWISCLPRIVVGSNFSFTVIVGSGVNAQTSDRGADLLSFVGDPPVLTSLVGCTPIGGSAVRVTGCPTSGGTTMVITAKTAKGLDLKIPQLFVNGNQCVQVGTKTSTGFSCVLPAGVGVRVPVELRDLTTSWFGDLITYAPPQIIRVSSPNCENKDSFSLVKCVGSPVTIYIDGNNFGASGATVMINAIPFTPQHQTSLPNQTSGGPNGLHRFLKVTVTAPSQVFNKFTVQQSNGVVGSVVGTFELAPCLSGYERSGTACSICAAGKYAYLEACYNCPGGTSQPLIGQSACDNCLPGYVQESTGQRNCTACGAGSFAVGTRACATCSEGKFSTDAANSVCTDCRAGTFAPSRGRTACELCAPGSYSTSNALMCEDCPAGRVSQTNASAVCLDCPRGTFQTSPGLTRCENCGPGQYSPTSGSRVCLRCSPGSFHNASRQTSCDLCPMGSSQVLWEAVSCEQCETGKFARALGATICEDCAPGQFTNYSSASACTMCSPGSFQDKPGQVGCEECKEGYYSAGPGNANCQTCAPGYFQNVTGSAECHLCPTGYISNAQASQVCSICGPGTFQPGVGQQRCFSCSPGKYQPAPGTTSCLACSAGRASTSEGSVGCSECPAARFSDTSARVCLSCPPSTIQPLPGQPSCIECTAGSSPNELGLRCLCQVGFYSAYRADGELICPRCPQGSGSCALVGTQFTEITTLPGYWRFSENATDFYRCKTPTHCTGQDSCAPFRTGPMCALCVPGYKSGGVGSQCSECPATKAASWGITVAICLLLILLLVTTYYIALRVANAQQDRILRLVEQRNKEAQRSLAASLKPDDAYFEELRQEIHGVPDASDFDTDDLDEVPEVVLAKPTSSSSAHMSLELSRRAPNFMYKVKILIGFFQIASYLPSQGDIAWPGAFVEFISAFSFFNFDFIPWQTLGCAAGINYFTKTIIVGFVPVIAIVVLIAFFTVSYFMTDYSPLELQLEKGQRRAAFWRQFVRLLLFTIFLLYPLVSKVAFGVYNCVQIGDVSYLVADFELLCHDDTWRVYAIIDGFFVALYPIGIPVAYIWILYSHKHQMREPETILVLGFLYEAYTDSAWYWELVDMTHKLILTSIIVFAPNEQRMAWNMAIMGVYLVALLLCMPYVRKGDDRFHMQVQATLFAIAFVGYILHQDKPYVSNLGSPSQLEALIASLLIIIVLLLLISFVVISGRNIRKIYAARKQLKKASAESAFEQVQPTPAASNVSLNSKITQKDGLVV